MPRGYELALAALAFIFHTQPSELAAMDVDDLRFWLDRATDLNNLKNRGG